jgi:hypothetical protein
MKRHRWALSSEWWKDSQFLLQQHKKFAGMHQIINIDVVSQTDFLYLSPYIPHLGLQEKSQGKIKHIYRLSGWLSHLFHLCNFPLFNLASQVTLHLGPTDWDQCATWSTWEARLIKFCCTTNDGSSSMYSYKQIACRTLSYQLYFVLKQHQVHSSQLKDNMPLHHREKALESFKEGSQFLQPTKNIN